jgi:hypothetical protein
MLVVFVVLVWMADLASTGLVIAHGVTMRVPVEPRRRAAASARALLACWIIAVHRSRWSPPASRRST